MKNMFFLYLPAIFFASTAELGHAEMRHEVTVTAAKPKVLYGTASYYADKFNGRQTANGEIYDGSKFTAACNVLPLGTWIRVTNMRNNRSVIVKTNDRLHPR